MHSAALNGVLYLRSGERFVLRMKRVRCIAVWDKARGVACQDYNLRLRCCFFAEPSSSERIFSGARSSSRMNLLSGSFPT